MNKYFLSLMSILILFQSFKVWEEIFYHENDFRKGYVIVPEEEEKKDVKEEKQNTLDEKKIDFKSLFSSANIEKGKKLSKQCVACHDFSKNLKVKVGPPLWGVVGRDSAVISDFKYSDSLASFKKKWSRKELFYFLEKPKDYIKGTKMIYKGLSKTNDRVNLISYLESLQ